MPLSTDPDDLIPFSLLLDEKRPEDKRPVFLLRFLSVPKLLKVQRLYQEAVVGKDDEVANAKMNEILAIGIAGWKHINAKYESGNPGDALDAADILTAGEKAELAKAVGLKPRLTETDRKNSASRPSSSTENSAPIAPTSVETNPTDPTASSARPATAPAAKPAKDAA